MTEIKTLPIKLLLFLTFLFIGTTLIVLFSNSVNIFEIISIFTIIISGILAYILSYWFKIIDRVNTDNE